MKLRRLLSLSPPEEDRLAEPGPPPEDPDWDLLSELDRLRNAIAHTNVQFLERRVAQAEERAIELDELVEALRSQRDRLQTYFEQQRDRADRAESAAAVDKLRRSLQSSAGKDYLSADAATDVRRYFTVEDLTPEQKERLRES